VAHFDNSASNPANPDPTRTVTWGDQTWDEMMIGYFDFALAEPRDKSDPSSTSRAEQFMKQVAAGTLKTDALQASAAGALKSKSAFKAWGLDLQKSFPQVARVDWMTVSDGKLTIQRVAEQNRFGGAGAGLSVPASAMHLAQIASSGKVAVIPNTGSIKTPDFRLMKRFYASSLHVPAVRHDQKGVISFWSGEESAFPPEAVKPLESLAGKLSDEN
jgi:hypothetical protein